MSWYDVTHIAYMQITMKKRVICYCNKPYTVQYKILEGENFGKTAYCKNCRIFWQMPKSGQKYKAFEVSAFTEQKSFTETFHHAYDFTV